MINLPTCLASSSTSDIFLPINLYTEKKVFSGFTTACLLAICPTSLSPFLVYATTDGVVLCPSALVTIVGFPPSMAATALLVVPSPYQPLSHTPPHCCSHFSFSFHYYYNYSISFLVADTRASFLSWLWYTKYFCLVYGNTNDRSGYGLVLKLPFFFSFGFAICKRLELFVFV